MPAHDRLSAPRPTSWRRCTPAASAVADQARLNVSLLLLGTGVGRERASPVPYHRDSSARRCQEILRRGPLRLPLPDRLVRSELFGVRTAPTPRNALAQASSNARCGTSSSARSAVRQPPAQAKLRDAAGRRIEHIGATKNAARSKRSAIVARDQRSRPPQSGQCRHFPAATCTARLSLSIQVRHPCRRAAPATFPLVSGRGAPLQAPRPGCVGRPRRQGDAHSRSCARLAGQRARAPRTITERGVILSPMGQPGESSLDTSARSASTPANAFARRPGRASKPRDARSRIAAAVLDSRMSLDALQAAPAAGWRGRRASGNLSAAARAAGR